MLNLSHGLGINTTLQGSDRPFGSISTRGEGHVVDPSESPSFDTSYATLHSTAEKWRIYPVAFFAEGLSKTIQVYAGAC
ncbi:hypothetical protein DTO013E5_7926 [Penicillium roqueforti]|uniref:uncharacterized protein n=1 Tax=Penicillium roqueforti TaxID=5082 RepID=UPI00190B75F5|nr:uncharacterized protein LCP9604111_7725 [Penicillium roqueforti]KAF9243342.1 hypothetical protein LCP9604111_7725 [Penicillium roqueforti]KAI1833882.1 hypothetical protein CBS147337_5437 [Penicillium roqueforti]KAI2685770.1 hypothetical protein CBS147355_1257 [Penicillium roqueforti]KAI2691967.1 hypothetical protein LCP963914a_61 [Penicillium roqueforti]KAI2704957.1 hypothetical protein CBS147372_1260 [Penicillium roqueforti]